MNRRRLLPVTLAASLLGNGVAAVLWWRAGSASESPPPVALAPAAPRVASPAPDTWGALEPAALRDRLLAAGVPGPVVRGLVRGRLLAPYHRLLDETMAEWLRLPLDRRVMYPPSEALTPEQHRRLHAAQRAAENEIARLVPRAEAPFRSEDDLEFAFLPPGKAERALQLRDAWRAEQALGSFVSGGLWSVDEVAAAENGREAYQAALAELLDPRERVLYEARQSPVFQSLRQELDGFPLDDAIFLALTEASAQPVSDHEAMLAEALGPERYAAFNAHRDPDRRALREWQGRGLVAPAQVDAVLALRERTAGASREIADAPDVPTAEKRRRLVALAEQTRAELGRLLGPAAVDGYLTLAGNRWLEPIGQGGTVRGFAPTGAPYVEFRRTEN